MSQVNDPKRLASLRATQLLDDESDEAFERLTRLATKLLGASVAAISLVDVDRQFFLASTGLPEPWASRRQTPLSHSFCKHVVETEAPLRVGASREHPLVQDNLAIEALGVESYLGVPLVTPDGDVLGALCAIDGASHHWTEDDLRVLSDLAAVVMSEARARATSRALASSNDRLRRLADAAFEAIAISAQGVVIDANESFCQLFGYTHEQLVGMRAESFVPPSEHTRVTHAQRTGLEAVYETVGLRADGSTFPAEVRGRMIEWVDRTVRVTAIRDLTESHRKSAALARQTLLVDLLRASATEANEAEQSAAAIQAILQRVALAMQWPVGHAYRVHATPDGLRLESTDLWYLSDPELLESFWSAAASAPVAPGAGLAGRVLATGRAQWIDDIHGDPTFPHHDAAEACGLHGGLAFPVRLGAEIVAVLEFYSARVEAPDERLLDVMANVGTMLGRVVERERARALLEQHAAEVRALSLRDELTGLCNRRGFLELARLGVRLADRSQRSALVVFIDLNGMKPINDRYGHEEGDSALCAAASVLRATFRDSDVIARLGGDEFAVFAPDVATEQGRLFLERLRANVQFFNDTPDDSRPWHLSLSSGISTYDPHERRTIEEVLEEADARMYEAKRNRARTGESGPPPSLAADIPVARPSTSPFSVPRPSTSPRR